jgi:hypothetical protein
VFLNAPRLGGLQAEEDAAFATQIGEKLINYIHGKTLANERQTDTHRPSALEIVLQYSSKAEK